MSDKNNFLALSFFLLGVLVLFPSCGRVNSNIQSKAYQPYESHGSEDFAPGPAAAELGFFETGLYADYGSALASPSPVKVLSNIWVFPSTAQKIIWFGRLDLKGRAKSFLAADLRSEWKNPSGITYSETRFSSFAGTKGIFEVSMEIPRVWDRKYEGEWRVDIFREGQLIDQKSFLLLDPDRKESASLA